MSMEQPEKKPPKDRREFIGALGAAALVGVAAYKGWLPEKPGTRRLLEAVFGKKKQAAELKGRKMEIDSTGKPCYYLVLDINEKGNHYYFVDKESYDRFQDDENGEVEFVVNADQTLTVNKKR